MFRRNFLKSTGLLSLSPMVPAFVNSLAHETKAERDRRVLVVVELSGGNDGLNTLVPHLDEGYAKARPKLKLDSNSLLRVTDSMGLHPSMGPCKELLDEGEFAIVNSVGYPNPNRSHFESMAIWHHGRLESRREDGSGWLGHALDLARNPQQFSMDGYFVGTEAVSEALISRRAQVAALSRFADLQLDRSMSALPSSESNQDVAQYVQRQMANAYATAKQIESVSKIKSGDGFPNTKLGQQLRLISQLMKSGSNARVYYTVQSGYDTHSSQINTHARLLSTYSSAIKAFVDDLKIHGLADRTVVLTFSEFGRRVRENETLGTDHGTAGPVFLAGTRIKPGLHGEATDLSDLVDGDIKSQFDFRRIYATVLDQWLGVPSKVVLGEQFEHLELIS